MTKLFLKGFRNLTLISLLLVSFLNLNAQMHCRSTLGGHLTPFSEDFPLLWAVEGTMAPGIMTSAQSGSEPAKLNGGMLLGALDYTVKKHSFYLEGGYKNWNNSELAQPIDETSRNLGVRQAFYSYRGDKNSLKIGLHETKLGSYFLVDERILGVSLDRKMGAVTLNTRLGTVLDNFARMGRFCGNRHLYSLIQNDFTENIGEKPGETNLVGFAVNWNPHYKKIAGAANENEFDAVDATDVADTEDEFSETEEFGEFDEFGGDSEFSESSEFGNSKKELIKNVGFVVYNEFGEIIPDNKLYLGSIVDFNLGENLMLQAGAIYQNMKLNNSIVYIVTLKRSFTWESGAYSNIGAGYIGKYNIDENAIFQPLFSNLFLGEIMRLDATDFPLWKTSITHNFPGKLKIHLGLKAVGQIENNETSEIDFEIGLKPFNHLKMTAIFSKVKSLALPDDILMARLELRLAF